MGEGDKTCFYTHPLQILKRESNIYKFMGGNVDSVDAVMVGGRDGIETEKKETHFNTLLSIVLV